MLVLPSVGSQVKKILLNESATKAKLFFDDGSTAIIATKNTPSTTAVKKVVKTPTGTSVVQKKKVIKRSVAENIGFRTVKTSQGMINVPTAQAISESTKQNVQDIIARSKKRAEMLEAQTMDASARAAASMTEGAEVSLT